MSSIAKKNELAVDAFMVADKKRNPISGIAPGAFTVELYDPTGSEVSGTITVTISELGGGAYRTSFTPNSVGNWMLVVKHSTYFKAGKSENYRVFNRLFDDLFGGGAGNRVVEITVEDDATTDPIPGVWIEVYDASITNLLAFGFTDMSGQITFMLDDGIYKVYLSKLGYYVFSPLPKDLTVSSSLPPPDVQITYQGTAFDPGTPPSADTCVVYGWEQDAQGTGLAVKVQAEIVGDQNFLETNPHIVGTVIEVTSDLTHMNGPGYWSMTLLKSGAFASGDRKVVYKFTLDEKVMRTVIIPDLANVAFKKLANS